MAEPTCEDLLASLLKQKGQLDRLLSSGIAEVEQPQLGRTTYRSYAELQASMTRLNGQIADLMVKCGLTDPDATYRKVRRPIYPVVQEI